MAEDEEDLDVLRDHFTRMLNENLIENRATKRKSGGGGIFGRRKRSTTLAPTTAAKVASELAAKEAALQVEALRGSRQRAESITVSSRAESAESDLEGGPRRNPSGIEEKHLKGIKALFRLLNHRREKLILLSFVKIALSSRGEPQDRRDVDELRPRHVALANLRAEHLAEECRRQACRTIAVYLSLVVNGQLRLAWVGLRKNFMGHLRDALGLTDLKSIALRRRPACKSETGSARTAPHGGKVRWAERNAVEYVPRLHHQRSASGGYEHRKERTDSRGSDHPKDRSDSHGYENRKERASSHGSAKSEGRSSKRGRGSRAGSNTSDKSTPGREVRRNKTLPPMNLVFALRAHSELGRDPTGPATSLAQIALRQGPVVASGQVSPAKLKKVYSMGHLVGVPSKSWSRETLEHQQSGDRRSQMGRMSSSSSDFVVHRAQPKKASRAFSQGGTPREYSPSRISFREVPPPSAAEDSESDSGILDREEEESALQTSALCLPPTNGEKRNSRSDLYSLPQDSDNEGGPSNSSSGGSSDDEPPPYLLSGTFRSEGAKRSSKCDVEDGSMHFRAKTATSSLSTRKSFKLSTSKSVGFSNGLAKAENGASGKSKDFNARRRSMESAYNSDEEISMFDVGQWKSGIFDYGSHDLLFKSIAQHPDSRNRGADDGSLSSPRLECDQIGNAPEFTGGADSGSLGRCPSDLPNEAEFSFGPCLLSEAADQTTSPEAGSRQVGVPNLPLPPERYVPVVSPPRGDSPVGVSPPGDEARPSGAVAEDQRLRQGQGPIPWLSPLDGNVFPWALNEMGCPADVTPLLSGVPMAMYVGTKGTRTRVNFMLEGLTIVLRKTVARRVSGVNSTTASAANSPALGAADHRPSHGKPKTGKKPKPMTKGRTAQSLSSGEPSVESPAHVDYPPSSRGSECGEDCGGGDVFGVEKETVSMWSVRGLAHTWCKSFTRGRRPGDATWRALILVLEESVGATVTTGEVSSARGETLEAAGSDCKAEGNGSSRSGLGAAKRLSYIQLCAETDQGFYSAFLGVRWIALYLQSRQRALDATRRRKPLKSGGGKSSGRQLTKAFASWMPSFKSPFAKSPKPGPAYDEIGWEDPQLPLQQPNLPPSEMVACEVEVPEWACSRAKATSRKAARQLWVQRCVLTASLPASMAKKI